jgi:hypothetical protein
MFGEGQHQAAGQQERGVDGSEQDVHMGASDVESLRVAGAIYGVGREQRAEHHDFICEEDPHPGACGFALLLRRPKLLPAGECGRFRQVVTPLSSPHSHTDVLQ